MGAVLAKCLKVYTKDGEMDLNNNGIPDSKELVLLVENYLKNDKEKSINKRNKKILKKILK